MNHIRDVPELHAALKTLALEHVHLSGPDEDGRYSRWISCSECSSVFTVPARVVSAICADCAAPCAEPDCGLMVYEHVDGCCELHTPEEIAEEEPASAELAEEPTS